MTERCLSNGRRQTFIWPTRNFHLAEEALSIGRGPRAVAGIEVKASATVTAADFKGLRKLQQAAGASFRNGILLYDGETVAQFGKSLYAVPIRTLWE